MLDASVLDLSQRKTISEVKMKRRAFYYEEGLGFVLGPSNITVFEEERLPEPTGLYDSKGNAIWSVEVKNRPGFLADHGS